MLVTECLRKLSLWYYLFVCFFLNFKLHFHVPSHLKTLVCSLFHYFVFLFCSLQEAYLKAKQEVDVEPLKALKRKVDQRRKKRVSHKELRSCVCCCQVSFDAVYRLLVRKFVLIYFQAGQRCYRVCKIATLRCALFQYGCRRVPSCPTVFSLIQGYLFLTITFAICLDHGSF